MGINQRTENLLTLQIVSRMWRIFSNSLSVQNDERNPKPTMLNYNSYKKVLLREPNRHIARRVASTRSASWWGGGVPPSSPDVCVWGGVSTPIQFWQTGGWGTSILLWWGYLPLWVGRMGVPLPPGSRWEPPGCRLTHKLKCFTFPIPRMRTEQIEIQWSQGIR